MPKETTNKKKSPAQKRVRATKQKPAAKKTAKKVAKKVPKKTAKKVTQKQATKKTNTKKSEVVVLPEKVSPKAKKRAEELESELQKYIDKSVYAISYVSAFCFILVGGFLTISSLVNPEQYGLPAQLITNSAGSTSDYLAEPKTKTQESTVNSVDVNESEFEFKNNIPENISTDTKVGFSLTNAEKVRTQLVATDGSKIDLQINHLSESEYETFIKTNVEPNYYELRVSFTTSGDDKREVRSSEIFFVGSSEQEQNFGSLTYEKKESSDSNSEPNLNDSTATSSATGTESVNDKAELDEKPTIKLIEPEQSEVTGAFRLTALVGEDLPFTELYARPLNSLQERFLTLGTKQSGQVRFVVDTKNLPNGQYEFFAKTELDGQEVQSNSIKLTVAKSLDAKENLENGEEFSVDIPEKEEGDRDFLSITEEDYSSTTDEDLKTTVNQIVNNNQTKLKDAYNRYASAVQSGDAMMVESAQNRLEKARQDIVNRALEQEDVQAEADDIDEHLTKRMKSIQEKVDTFEQIRTERSEGTTAVDTDQDGISDFDEINLYSTDPNSADTDDDGVSDGVEIVQGYDPTSSATEAVMRFQSPQETVGLERDDVLEIENVTPIVTESNEDELIRTEIQGKALPGSYITLYIFSSPTIVTIKTDQDGSFVYTFDKELADGEHEIYVAVTDNTGAIMAQSQPFSFVKRAEAYEPVTPPVAQSANRETIVYSKQGPSYGTVLGTALLAFGLILLMIGINLRNKQEGAVTTISNVQVT